MLAALRFVGIVNAAVWLGGAIFFTFGVGPGFFSDEMLRLLPRSHAGAAAQLIIERYFLLQQVCAAIALVHLIVEWLYSGRPLRMPVLCLILALFVIGLSSRQWLLPRMKTYHYQIYAAQSSPEAVAQSRIYFGRWHGFSQVLNLLVLGGALGYLWICSRSNEGSWKQDRTIAGLPLRS
jgi:hypothetical protein